MAVTHVGWYWFGLAPPASAIAAWGARAIIRGGTLDLLHDRQQCDDGVRATPDGSISPTHQELIGAINVDLIPQLKERLAAWDPAFGGSSRQVTELTSGRVTLRCSPQASHGYLYIVAYIEDGPENGPVDPNPRRDDLGDPAT